MLLAAGAPRALGTASDPWLRFGEEAKEEGSWAGRRVLMVNERPAFELSFWCGTCQFVFRRLEGANEGGSIQELQDRLAHGLRGLDDDVIEPFGAALAVLTGDIDQSREGRLITAGRVRTMLVVLVQPGL